MPFCNSVQLVSIPEGGSPVWEDGPNRGFTLVLPPVGEPPGNRTQEGGIHGFLVALHWGLPSAVTEAIHFPVISSTDASSSSAALALKEGALHHLPMCSFTVPGKALKVGDSLVLCGDIPELGSWDPSKGLQLEWREGDSWVGQIRLPSYAAFNAKVGSTSDWGVMCVPYIITVHCCRLQLVVCGGGGSFFEPGPNRSLDLTGILKAQLGERDGNASFRTDLQHHRRVLLPHCAFTCYWGVDVTPVIVGVG